MGRASIYQVEGLHFFARLPFMLVIPALAGIQLTFYILWIPACAGMTCIKML